MFAQWLRKTLGLAAAVGGGVVVAQASPPGPVSLAIELDRDEGQVSLNWPRRPDSVHTLLVTDPLGGGQLVDARIVPDDSGEEMRVDHPVDLEADARFFRLKTRSMVPVVADDFVRETPEMQPMGTPPLGDPWTVIGLGGALPGRYGVVANGDAFTDLVGFGGVTYLCQELPSPPCLLEADFRWEPHEGTGVEGVLTIACSPGNRPSWIHELVHVRIARRAVYLDLRENGQFFLTVRSDIPELPLQTSHNCRIYLDQGSQAILIMLNGKEVLRYRHPTIERLGGRFVFWEHYYERGGSSFRLYIERVLAAVAEAAP